MGGGLSKEERQQASYLFTKIDSDNTGTISINNLKAFFPGWSKEGLLKILRHANATRSGEITKSGFDSLIKHEAAYTWSRYDKAGTNDVGVEEIEAVLFEVLKKMSDEDIQKLAQEKLQEWDTNGDGKVSLAEFAEYVLRCVATDKDPWEFLEE